jgi:hypothetical protein
MHHTAGTSVQTLHYTTRDRPRRARRSVIAVASTPAVYIAAYSVLRLCGVFYPFYNQGSYEIDGSTNVRALDILFSPAVLVEDVLRTQVEWLPPPSGG